MWQEELARQKANYDAGIDSGEDCFEFESFSGYSDDDSDGSVDGSAEFDSEGDYDVNEAGDAKDGGTLHV